MQALVETKLSQMVLDKKLNGILDQGLGSLELFDEVHKDKTLVPQGFSCNFQLSTFFFFFFLLFCSQLLCCGFRYEAALDTITNIGHVVETLSKKAQALF